MQEIWKDIPNYQGLYQISNLGNIRSLLNGSKRVLKPNPSNCGYYKVELYNNGKSKVFYIHRLVANSFIPNPDNKKQVNHIDGDKSHNCVDNLEWVTPSENQKHAFSIGLSKSNMLGKKGSLNPKSKKIEQFDSNGNFIKSWDSIAEACEFYNCNHSSISNCIAGRKKTVKGFVWKYKS